MGGPFERLEEASGWDVPEGHAAALLAAQHLGDDPSEPLGRLRDYGVPSYSQAVHLVEAATFLANTLDGTGDVSSPRSENRWLAMASRR